MVSLRKWLFVTLAALVPLCANAETPDKKLTYELYVKSGLEKQIEQIPSLIQAGITQSFDKKNGSQQTPDNLSAKLGDFMNFMKDYFSSESTKKNKLEQIETLINQKDMQEILKWLDSPVGKKCIQLEEAASSPEAISEQTENFPKQLKKTPPSKERLMLIQKLNSAVKAEENVVEIVMGMQFAIATAFTFTLPSEIQQSFFEKISNEIKNTRHQIQAAAKSETGSLYTYRGLTDSELEEYVKFANTDTGVIYHSITTGALKKALTEYSIKLGNFIAKAIENIYQ